MKFNACTQTPAINFMASQASEWKRRNPSRKKKSCKESFKCSFSDHSHKQEWVSEREINALSNCRCCDKFNSYTHLKHSAAGYWESKLKWKIYRLLTRCPAGMLMLKSFIMQSFWFAYFNDTRRNSMFPHCGHFAGNDSSWKWYKL